MKFKTKIFLAPMAEVNDPAFRILCSNYGAGLTYTEMLSCAALIRGNENTLKLFDIQKCEKPIAVQLFGTKIDEIKKAVKVVQDKVDIIDFNMGCPMSKIVDAGAGSALLKDPEKVREIVRALVKTSKKPVSIKIRSGWNKKTINAVEIAKIIEEEGASMLTLHARTRSQVRSGESDWDLIRQVKEAVKIPVVGNGDISCPEDIERMFEESGCDYVMIGREAIKNPYIFKQYSDYLKNGKYDEPDKLEIVSEYLKLAKKYGTKFSYVKKHIVKFTKGLKNSARLREEINKTKKIEEIKKIEI